MNDLDQFDELMKAIKYASIKLVAKQITLGDYYDIMAEFFDYLEPSKGSDYGGYYNFKKDAEELRDLSTKEKQNEKQ